MKILNRLYYIIKSASLIAVVLILAFTVPMSAHTNMSDHVSIDQTNMSMDHSDHTHDMPAIELTSSDNTNDNHEHDGAGCCETGMCISAALIENFSVIDVKQVHNHIALLPNKMTSADKTRLMRPPSL